MVFMADNLAALHDTAETEFATDLRTENTFPGVQRSFRYLQPNHTA